VPPTRLPAETVATMARARLSPPRRREVLWVWLLVWVPVVRIMVSWKELFCFLETTMLDI
jgi:hypothetical protein